MIQRRGAEHRREERRRRGKGTGEKRKCRENTAKSERRQQSATVSVS